MYSSARLHSRFNRERARDPHRDYRAALIMDMRTAGLELQNEVQLKGQQACEENKARLKDAQSRIEEAHEKGGYAVSVPALRHIAYHAPAGTDVKEWAVHELIEQATEWAEIDLRKAAEDLGKACRFKYEDPLLDSAVVPVYVDMMRRLAEQDGNVRAVFNLRDTAYLAIHNSLLEREVCAVFEEIMECELSIDDPDRYMQVFIKSLGHPERGTALEDSLGFIAMGGIKDLVREERQKLYDLFEAWRYTKPQSVLREKVELAMNAAGVVRGPSCIM